MPFDRQPHLQGELLELRPLRADDWPALFAVASDPLIWEQHPQSERYQEVPFRAFFREALESGGALVAIDRKDGRVIGTSRYHGYDAERSEIEIGWTFLARSHWGGANNGEMKRLMLRHAARFVRSVIFVIGPQNMRSRRAVEKIGALWTGSRVGPDGQERVVYRIDTAQFADREYRVVFSNITGCAVGVNDIFWSVTVSAGSEAEAIERAIEQARMVNRETGLPPHGLKVSEPELWRLACIAPK